MNNTLLKVFGEPKLPLVLKDCTLIIDSSTSIILPIVYVYNNQKSYSIYQQGILSPINIIFGKYDVKGYFEINDINLITFLFSHQGKNDYTIKYFVGKNEFYRIENIAIAKTNTNFKDIRIKFIAKRLVLIK